MSSDFLDEQTSQRLTAFEAVLRYTFVRRDWLQVALTHKSFANEQSIGQANTVGIDNERLEFLGDAVLDLALSESLMRRFSGDNEGNLSKKRASLVNEEILSRLALSLGLDTMIRLGRGEAKTGGLQKPRILASSLEAIFGAVFSDGGYKEVSRVIDVMFADRMDEISKSDVDFREDFKTRLQERLQELHRATPGYKVDSESGPDHDKQFLVSVSLSGSVLATGTGKSKKAAEQEAARQALETLPPKNDAKSTAEKSAAEKSE